MIQNPTQEDRGVTVEEEGFDGQRRLGHLSQEDLVCELRQRGRDLHDRDLEIAQLRADLERTRKLLAREVLEYESNESAPVPDDLPDAVDVLVAQYRGAHIGVCDWCGARAPLRAAMVDQDGEADAVCAWGCEDKPRAVSETCPDCGLDGCICVVDPHEGEEPEP